MRLESLHHRVINDARSIHAGLQSVFPRHLPAARLGTQMNVVPFIARLNTVTTLFGIFNTVSFCGDAAPHDVIFSGDWSPKYERRQPNIDIEIHWELPFRHHRLILSETYWSGLYFEYWWYILHELIHRHQAAIRGRASIRVFRPNTQEDALRNEQLYLGDMSEVEAYAFNEALELMTQCGATTWSDAKKHLPKRPDNASVRVNFSYTTYLKTFTNTQAHPAMRAFRRKTRRWFDLIVQHQDAYHQLGLHGL